MLVKHGLAVNNKLACTHENELCTKTNLHDDSNLKRWDDSF